MLKEDPNNFLFTGLNLLETIIKYTPWEHNTKFVTKMITNIINVLMTENN